MDISNRSTMVNIQVNPNFHILSGKNILDRSDVRFQEYRKKWEEWPRNFYTGDFPLHLDVEASNVCNLRCEFCETNYEKVGTKYGYMDFDLFKKVIDEGIEYGLYAIKLNSGARGEPLLHKNIATMVEYAKKKGIIDVYMNTNAVLLTQRLGKKLIDAGLDRISISFEGTEPEIYEKYRAGAKFDKVRRNILEFIKLRNSLNSEIPKIRIQTVATPELLPEIKEYGKYWSKLVDEVAFIDFKDYSNKKKDLVSDWVCPYLWQRMMITWDGTISVCGFDYTDDHKLGNVKKDSIREAWKGKEMERIRKLHREGKSHVIAICNGCPFRTTEILKRK